MKLPGSIRIATLFAALYICGCKSNGTNSNSNNADSTVGGELQKAGQAIGTAARMAGKDVVKAADTVAGKVSAALYVNRDSDFISQTTVNNNDFIRLLQAGMNDGTNAELRKDAKDMFATHRNIKAQLSKIAATDGIAENTESHSAAELEDLGNRHKKGADWDKAWANLIDDRHNNIVNHFEHAEGNVKDPSLDDMIHQNMPTLHADQDIIKNLQDHLGK